MPSVSGLPEGGTQRRTDLKKHHDRGRSRRTPRRTLRAAGDASGRREAVDEAVMASLLVCSAVAAWTSATSAAASSSQACARVVTRCSASGDDRRTSLLAFNHSAANATCLLASSKASLRRPCLGSAFAPVPDHQGDDPDSCGQDRRDRRSGRCVTDLHRAVHLRPARCHPAGRRRRDRYARALAAGGIQAQRHAGQPTLAARQRVGDAAQLLAGGRIRR